MAVKQKIQHGITWRWPLNRRFSSFLVCLLLSAMAWLLQALSKEYKAIHRIPIEYANLPADRLVTGGLPDSVDAELRGSGFALLTWRLGRDPGTLLLDVRQAKRNASGNLALLTNLQTNQLNSSFGRGAHIVRIMPDTIAISYAPRVTRRVPVRPRVTVTTAPQFQIVDSIRAEPAFVEISGAVESVNAITFIETEPRAYSGLNKTRVENVPLNLSGELRQLEVKPKTVTLTLKAGKYTEGRFLLPVVPVHTPSGVDLKTIPDKVEVIFQVPLADYKNIRPDQFRVVADYSHIFQGQPTLKLDIVRSPLLVRNIRLEPERVDYLLRK